VISKITGSRYKTTIPARTGPNPNSWDTSLPYLLIGAQL
jgi:hypothetical protein